MFSLDQAQEVSPLGGSTPSGAVSPESSSGGAGPNPESNDSIRVNKKGFIEVEGQVLELLPSATFKVLLQNGHEILAHLSGRMRMHRILILPGDRVRIEMTPYDMTKGRVVYRF